VVELATTSRPYARAAFAAAGSASQLAQWSASLARAAAAVQDPQLEPLIGNPRVPVSQLVDFLLELATPGKAAAQETVHERNFLQLLADNRRLKLLPEIDVQFEVLRAEAERIADVEVTSAQELSAEQSKTLQAALERRLGLSVRLHPQVDKSLIGGAIVRYRDFVVDGSLRGRIERLGAAMSGA
jgi:F-type H+-transporting ATPase subunit delta